MPVFCLNRISANFFLKGLIDNKSALVQVFDVTKLLESVSLMDECFIGHNSNAWGTDSIRTV